jgi:MYXO-CTERM domain-containing protein
VEEGDYLFRDYLFQARVARVTDCAAANTVDFKVGLEQMAHFSSAVLSANQHWRKMRKTVAVISATGALLFGGAGVAHAATAAPAPASTTTTLAAGDDNGDHDSDKTGLWGLLGLLGLGGLAGLKRRNDTHPTAGPATTPGRGV